MITLAQVIDQIIAREGGYSDHPHDRGGPTMYGITEAVARRHGYTGAMQDLPIDTARKIYAADYYHRPGFDRIANVSPGIAAELTDTAVNMGPEIAGQMLQKCLNAFNGNGTHWLDLKVDGVIGPVTIEALARFVTQRGSQGEQVMVKALNCLQGARYIEIAELRPANESFVYGWIRHRV